MRQETCSRASRIVRVAEFADGRDAGRGLLSAVVRSIGFGIPWVGDCGGGGARAQNSDRMFEKKDKAEGVIIPQMLMLSYIYIVHTYSNTGNYLLVVMSPRHPLLRLMYSGAIS